MSARLTIEYDGTGFAGWAVQPGQRTVQGELQRALGVLLPAPVSLVVAGRTDRGVHAIGQVASHEGAPAPVGGLNALLPDDVAVLASEPARDGFDARREATSRAYRYRVHAAPARSALRRGRALWVPYTVDVGLLHECAARLVGTHDFTAFTPSDTYHVRFDREVFAARWRAEGDSAARCDAGTRAIPGRAGRPETLAFEIEADAFMRHMNRTLVGTMLEVARGARSLRSFAELLDGAPRAHAGPTAPAHGLYLVGAGYEGRRVLA